MRFGWCITIKTTKGIVSLVTRWDGMLKISYPLGVEIKDEVIMETLDVELSRPVIIEDKTYKWGKYYSKRLNGDNGRIWIEQKIEYDKNGYRIDDNKECERIYGESNLIQVYSSNWYSKTSPDAPICESENTEAYRDKFIELLVKIAKQVGDIEDINLYSNECAGWYTEDMLMENGYDVVRRPNDDENDLGYYYAQDMQSNCEILLETSLFGTSTWYTMIQCPSTNNLTAENLIELIDKVIKLESVSYISPNILVSNIIGRN